METFASQDLDPFLQTGSRCPSSLDLHSLPEWDLLAGQSVSASPEAATPGQPDIEAEKKRTLCSLNCLEYLNAGDDEAYEALTAVQTHSARLRRQEFSELSQWARELLGDRETVDALRYIMLIHDIGKNGRVFKEMGIEEGAVDHDAVTVRLLGSPDYRQQLDSLLPTFRSLTNDQQRTVRAVLGVQLNFGQFLQAEAPAVSLEGVPADIDERTRGIYVLHAILDIAGAAGHLNPESSLILTSPTYQNMVWANATLADNQYSTSSDRYDAYLGHRAEQLEAKMAATADDELRLAKAQVRLACMLRYSEPDQFGRLKSAFEQQPAVVRQLLTEELNRDGLNDRATLPYYGPAMLKALSGKFGMPTALNYFAHVLQEVLIADRRARMAGEAGAVTADLAGLTRAINADELDPAYAAVRFSVSGELLMPTVVDSEPVSLEGLPSFEGGGWLRGKKIVVVGMGGGSDCLQAAMLGKVLDRKFGSKTSAVVSVRSAKHTVTGAGEQIGSASQEITSDTQAVGSWRFLENIPLEQTEASETPPPVYLLSSIEPIIVGGDVGELVKRTGAEVVIGVDTGGDSLYRVEQSAGLKKVDSTPDQDLNVLQALSLIERNSPNIKVYSSVVAPGVDTPRYAGTVLSEAGATVLNLNLADTTMIAGGYKKWRMDGAGSEEGRYGKTPLAWLKALSGQMGLQALELPVANVTSASNPWRAFVDITPAMSAVVLMDASKHYTSVSG